MSIQNAILAVNEREAAQLLGLSVAYLRKDRIGQRCVPFVRIGASVRYRPESLREFLAQREEGGGQR